MRRSGFKNQRKPMKRGSLDDALKSYHGFKPRKKALGPGKKTLAKQSAMHYAIYRYFQERGWENSEGEREAFCQVSHVFMTRGEAVAHHFTPRSELRKAGVEDLDAPHRLIICHWKAHNWLHAGGMGRPKGTEEARQFAIVEKDEANAVNGFAVKFSDQDLYDLQLHMAGVK